MNHKNAVKAKLSEGGTVFGIFQSMASEAVSEILANRGFDWILVDMEHGMMGLETAGRLFAAIDRGGPTPFVRVAGNDQATVKRALDAGAMGVMIPLVNSREEATRAVSYCKYPPSGLRGLGPGRASLYGVNLAEYSASADSEILVLLQAEHKDAIDHIDEIAQVPDIDVLFVGPYDLACSMGHASQPGHPEVEQAIAKALAAAQSANLVPGIFCMNAESAKKRAAQGFRFIAIGLDSVYLDSGIIQALKTLHAG
jgi:2-keto-3-deoxy-L-rhamnonate aldolase RhmA